ncbi:MAG: recombinase family protein [Pseudomonadota bacterium]
MTRVALYARYSSDRQREASIEDQLRLCRERAAREGWQVTDNYSDRAIKTAEARIVLRIFEDYAAGRSPRAIAHALNAEGIRGPSGKGWGPSTIHGNRQRGTGILNNALYVGRLVWNRLTYVKDPDTGKRLSRLNLRAPGSPRRCRNSGSSTTPCGNGSKPARVRCGRASMPTTIRATVIAGARGTCSQG